MNIKFLKIMGVFFALCFYLLFSFLYEAFPSFLTSIFAKVNNGLFENMKILFGCVLFSGVTQKIIVISKKEKINNICLSNFLGALISMPVFLIFYAPVYLLRFESLIFKSIIVILTIMIVEYVSYIIMKKPDYKYENKTIYMAVLAYLIFTIITNFIIR